MAVVFYTPEFELFIEKLDAISQINNWEKFGIICSGISSILAVVMASVSFYKGVHRNWVKIKVVKPFSSIDHNHKIENIGIQIESLYKTDIKIIFNIAYVKLSDSLILGFKAKNSKNDVIDFKQNFELIRTDGFNNKKYGSKMTMGELYREELKRIVSNNNMDKIKKGAVTVFTNVGYFKKKLSKEEVETFIRIFKEIVKQEKFE